jgi:hypothetical protein
MRVLCGNFDFVAYYKAVKPRLVARLGQGEGKDEMVSHGQNGGLSALAGRGFASQGNFGVRVTASRASDDLSSRVIGRENKPGSSLRPSFQSEDAGRSVQGNLFESVCIGGRQSGQSGLIR